MSNLSRPPYNDKDPNGYSWQKWFSSIFSFLAPLYWDVADDTLGIRHAGGVNQQVGLEVYFRTGNATQSLIRNGECVGFGGSNDEAVTCVPFIADGTMLSLYSMGIATQDIAAGAVGRVTAFGYVHDIDTTGTIYGETWNKGNILYASPTVAGRLTNIKPTAPNIVVPMAAVVSVSATTGIILVRPTQTLQLYYGSFLCTTSPTVPVANTAYTVPFNVTVAASGIAVGTPTSRLVIANSGQYEVSISVQAVKSSAAIGYIWTWARVNGVDVPNSAVRTTISGSNAEAVVARSILLSLNAGQYVEICYAADNTATSLISQAATAFAPAAPAVVVSMSQINQ